MQAEEDSNVFLSCSAREHDDVILYYDIILHSWQWHRTYSSLVSALQFAAYAYESALELNMSTHTYRATFDHTAEQLCEKLCEVDRWVADSVVDQVTHTFVEASAPINHLVQAATGMPASSTSPVSSSVLSLTASI